jgi:hypothetical protein
MEATIRGTELPMVGIRGTMLDPYDDGEPGAPACAGFQVSQEAENKLAIHFTDEECVLRVMVACSLLGGVLTIDIIDLAKVARSDPPAVPCGAEAVATASIRIHGRRKRR